MPWYRSGTVSITVGQTTVTGTSTDFALNARVGDAFQGPDGRWYEVANIASATVLSILPAYQGPTVAAGSYGLAPMQGYVKESADRLRQLVEQFGGTLSLLGTPADVAGLRQNIGAAGRGANSDITSISGLTTALTVAQGGTGASTPAGARSGLGLGSAAVASLGLSPGQVPRAESIGHAQSATSTKSWLADLEQGWDTALFAPGAPNAPTGGTGYWYKQTMRFGTGGNRLMIAWPYGVSGATGTIKLRSVYDGALTPEIELYHTGNTTRGSGGVLSAASPIVRVASVADSERLDLLEQTFEVAGAWGVANSEARGVTIDRVEVGVYRITGALGLAAEGWRIHDPCSPDGGRMLGITESEQDDHGVVTVRLFKQRWTLDGDGEMQLGKGLPMDVPASSWIDVRLQMPIIEVPVPLDLATLSE